MVVGWLVSRNSGGGDGRLVMISRNSGDVGRMVVMLVIGCGGGCE